MIKYLGLQLSNLFLHTAHMLIVGFSAVAWMFDTTRVYHLALQIGIAFSWFVIGYFKKRLGFCLVTDIHWKVLEKLNKKPATSSYIKFLADIFWPKVIKEQVCEAIAYKTFCFTSIASIVLMVVM